LCVGFLPCSILCFSTTPFLGFFSPFLRSLFSVLGFFI
jgi:hypothetical protein